MHHNILMIFYVELIQIVDFYLHMHNTIKTKKLA